MRDPQELAQILSRVRGRWRGEERYRTPDGPWSTSSAVFENNKILDGHGYAGTYLDSPPGGDGIACYTVVRLDLDGTVFVSWTPKEGKPLTFEGRWEGLSYSASRTDETGALQILSVDFAAKNQTFTRTETVGPDGRVVEVFEGRYHRIPAPAGKVAWRELTVLDAGPVACFYEEVLGVEARASPVEDYENFNLFDGAGRVTTAVSHARGKDADLPGGWLVYFTVDSLERAMTATARLGGRVVTGPKSYGPNRFAVLADPSGATFAAFEEQLG